jgi:hypothetical protein
MMDRRVMRIAYQETPSRGLVFLAMSLTVLVAYGCGARDYRDALSLAPVHGTVKCKGKTLDSGQVVFVPDKDSVGVMTTGLIQADGTYKLETAGREGAMVGWNRVIVRPYQAASQKPSAAAPPSQIPDKYSWVDKTPLRFEVKSGQNEYKIVLE